MIKLEVRITHTVEQVSIMHEYRAELPDSATPEQIAAVGAEAVKGLAVEEKKEEASNDVVAAATIAWPYSATGGVIPH